MAENQENSGNNQQDGKQGEQGEKSSQSETQTASSEQQTGDPGRTPGKAEGEDDSSATTTGNGQLIYKVSPKKSARGLVRLNVNCSTARKNCNSPYRKQKPKPLPDNADHYEHFCVCAKPRKAKKLPFCNHQINWAEIPATYANDELFRKAEQQYRP